MSKRRHSDRLPIDFKNLYRHKSYPQSITEFVIFAIGGAVVAVLFGIAAAIIVNGLIWV